MKTTLPAFEQAIRSHDKLLRRHDLAIWVGAEPTFTDRRSEAPEWLTNAIGPRKERHARRMLAECLKQAPGGAVLRTLGRQYPQEDQPRWNLGLYRRRNGQPVWSGPPDPLLESEPLPLPEGALEEFWERLAQRLGARGWTALLFAVESYPNLRVAFRRDRLPLLANPAREPRLARPSPHGRPIPPRGPRDELAQEGIFLVGIGWPGPEQNLGEAAAPCVELPACDEPALFLSLLEAVGEAANATRLPGLILTGFPPPVDATVAWTTLTPDPAVVELNTGADAGRRRLSGRGPNRLRRRRGRWTVALPAALQRPGQRLRRRRPVDPGRTDAGQQPVSGLPAPVAGPDRLFQPPPGAVVLFRWRFRRQFQPGVPPRRAYHRYCRGTGADPGPARPPAQPEPRTALAKPVAVPDRPRRQSPPQRNQHRKAVEPLSARARPTGTGGVSRVPHAAHPGAAGGPGGAVARHRRPADPETGTARIPGIGAGNCTTALPCRSTCAPICGRCSTNWPAPVWDWASR